MAWYLSRIKPVPGTRPWPLPGGQTMFIRGQRSRKRAWVHARYWMKRGYEVMVIEDLD